MKEIELVYDRGLKLAISYDDGKQEAEPTGSNVCAIDPGALNCGSGDKRPKFDCYRTQTPKYEALHKTTKQFVNWALAQDIKHVTFGDVEGVQRNTSARKKKSSKKQPRSRKHNRRMSQWTFGRMYAYLAYKLAAHGIKLSKQDERFTSQTCPVCGPRTDGSCC